MGIKPHSLEIRFAGEDYTPDQPQPDIRVENFCALLAHGKSKRAAVILSFPNASKDSASFRAARVLSDDRVRDRIAYLRAKIAQATATVSPALSQSVRDSMEAGGESEAANAALDATNGEPKMFDDSNIVRVVEKRRSVPPPDLTPAELRRIIAEGARNGNSAAISAAIKILDAQMSAPPQVADPAGLCAILFNGGGGGETLPYIVNRLVSIFGLAEISAEIDRIKAQSNMQSIEMQKDATNSSATKEPAQYATQSALCDIDAHGAPPGGEGAGPQGGGPAEGGGGGEGGESRAAEEV